MFPYNNCMPITINCHVAFCVVVSATITVGIATTTVDIMPTSVITQGINVCILYLILSYSNKLRQ